MVGIPSRVVHPRVKYQNMSNVNVKFNVTPRAFKFDTAKIDRNLTPMIFDRIIILDAVPHFKYILAFRSGSFEPGIVAEVGININHLSYFTVTESAVANKQKGSRA